jgi:HSP20 family protein
MKPQSQPSLTPVPTSTVLQMPGTPTIFDRRVKEIYDATARRAHELFERRGYAHGHHLEDWLRAESELLQPVPIEIIEDDDKLSVRAEVPGFKAKELDIRVEPSRLLIRGRKEEETERKTAIYSESQTSEIFRVVNLPLEVNPEKVTAALQDGVLLVSLPKVATTKTTRVEIKAA